MGRPIWNSLINSGLFRGKDSAYQRASMRHVLLPSEALTISINEGQKNH